MIEKPLVGLLDCNNFFVSCERVFRPDWRTRPVIVLSSNDGCVIARSQEIKDRGIPMGVPYFKIKDSLKDNDTVVCSANLALYRDFSRRVFELMRQHLEVVEQYSIDEAFFLIPSGTTALTVSEQLRLLVYQSLGLPVSVGIGQSKTQAKYANRCTKQTGVIAQWLQSYSPQSLEEIPLNHIWGVGKGMSLRFREAGLLTVADLLVVPNDRLKARFGIVAVTLQAELAGTMVSPVSAHPRSSQKSLMSSRTFASASTDYAVVADALTYHINHVAADLRALQCGARYLKIWAQPSRYSDYALQGIRAETVFTEPVTDTTALLKAALGLLRGEFKLDVPYQKVGVMVGGLAMNDGQQSLFGSTPDTSPVWSVVDALKQKYRGGQVWLGTIPGNATWKPKQSLLMPSYTTRWQDVPVVHTR